MQRLAIFFVVPIFFGSLLGQQNTQRPPVQIPPTDLSRSTEPPGTTVHTTYQVVANSQLPQKYANAHIARPGTDFADNVLNPSVGTLSSVPPNQVNLSDVHAFTNYVVLVGESVMPFASGQPQGENPKSIRTVYGLHDSDLGGGTIAIVDAFNYPTAVADIKTFATTLGVPCENCLEVKFAAGIQPPDNCDWAGEAALDVQWIHAVAPKAKIVLVEAKTSSMPDMMAAVDYAANVVKQAGGGVVSLSWGSTEFATENSLDSHFAVPGVVFVASSGDVGGVQTYPSESPSVVAVGGTTIVRNGNQVTEAAWNGSGGGPSAFESRPSFQGNLPNITGADPAKRWGPDVSADADPYSGVAVFDSTSCQGRSGWQVIGGTSLAAPLVAGMINVAKHSASGTQQELVRIYSHAGDSTKFRDVTTGSAGSFSATPGYDFVTGLGSPIPLDFDK